jgi:O-methyltransferase domain
MRQSADMRNGRESLLELVAASWLAQTIAAATQIGLFAQLDEERSLPELARTLNVDENRLARLVEPLEVAEVIERQGESMVLGPLGQYLRAEDPMTLAPLFSLVASGWHTKAWAALSAALATDRTAFQLAHGEPLLDYLEARPQDARLLERGYAAVQGPAGPANVPGAIAELAGELGEAAIVDVGGGDGTVLVELLRRNPGATGIVIDRPRQAEQASERFEREGLTGRATARSGNFFNAVPEGGDLYLACFVIEDWQDDAARRLLESCRAAMVDGAQLLVVEAPTKPESSLFSQLFDIEMMVVQGGQQRTLQEIEALLESARFQPVESRGSAAVGATVLYADPA